jgi:UDP-2,4-diacetamido-2,4,6-trideoxy-beta-L-altropyranose hydrolase
MRKILFYCDSSEILGSGHVMRCVALAEVFFGHGWEIIFSGNYEHPVWLSSYLKSLNFIKVVSTDIILDNNKIDVVVVDSYKLSEKKYKEYYSNATLKISIVDPINIPHEADIYFSNTPQKYFKKQFVKTNCYFGFEFALVRREISNLEKSKIISFDNPRIVIFTGGTAKSDVINFFLKVIEKSKADTKVIVFGKPPNSSIKNSGLDLKFEDFNPSYAKKLNRNDYIFCPSSGMSLELLTLQYPIILYKFTENQEQLYNALINDKIARGIGSIKIKSIQDTVKIFEDTIFKPMLTESLKQKKLFDGLGPLRVFEIITKHPYLK